MITGSSKCTASMPTGGKSTEGFCLTLPGKQLDVSMLLKEKKFRGKGNEEGALTAMRVLEEDGQGRLEEKQTKGSVKVVHTFPHPLGYSTHSS